MIFLGLVLIGFSVATWFYPEKVWRITIGWTTDDGTEPSDSYLIYLKILSVAFLFIVLMGCLAYLFD